ncbi:MAG: helix-turn-helix domain-containing protein [Fusobacterium sp.]|nr:helix-turn-helix domain-containing protein [Fusobacterium sp.]
MFDIYRFKDFPPIMDVEEVKKALNISKTSVYEKIREGKLKYYKSGKKFKIPKLYVVEYIVDECEQCTI